MTQRRSILFLTIQGCAGCAALIARRLPKMRRIVVTAALLAVAGIAEWIWYDAATDVSREGDLRSAI